MTRKELFKKYEQRYTYTNTSENEKLRPEIKELLKKPEAMILVAGIQEFFEKYLDGRTSDGVSYKN